MDVPLLCTRIINIVLYYEYNGGKLVHPLASTLGTGKPCIFAIVTGPLLGGYHAARSRLRKNGTSRLKWCTLSLLKVIFLRHHVFHGVLYLADTSGRRPLK